MLEKVQIIDFRTDKEKTEDVSFLPTRKHSGDAGADVYSSQDIDLNPGDVAKINLRFGLKLPMGYAGFIFPRSSMASQGLTCELPPVDCQYRGAIHGILTNNSSEIRTIRKGDRIGQLVIMPVELPIFTLEDCGEPDETDRGNGAFGSTGK